MALSNSGFPKKEKNQILKRDVFSRYGGRLTPEQLKREMWRVPLRPEEREYVKRVMERFDQPYFSRGITREEFYKGLEEMTKNLQDPISPEEVERIKKYFERF